MKDILENENLEPEVEFGEFDGSFDEMITKDYISPEYKKNIASNNVIILPVENFRDKKKPLFPSHTQELYEFLKSKDDSQMRTEILIEDKDYQEFDLHFDFTPLGLFLVENIAFPLFASALYDYLKTFFTGVSEGSKNIEIEIHYYNKKNTKIKKIKYKGPYNKFKELTDDYLGES